MHDPDSQGFPHVPTAQSSHCLVVGVSGGSGAGKRRIIDDYLMPVLQDRALILEHDWYYRELPDLMAVQGVTSQLQINYDHPDAYDNALLIRDIRALRAGLTIDVYPYQKGVGMRSSHPVIIEPRPVVIVDGMMVLAVPELAAELDLKAFVYASDEVRLRRRVARDLSFASEEESQLRFTRDVLPAHHQFVEPARATADFILDNGLDGEDASGVAPFLSDILARLASFESRQR
ncbi:MAG: uridine kinase [Myxococcota bacterium]